MQYFDCHADTLTVLHRADETLLSSKRDLDLERVHRFADRYGQIFALWKDADKLNGKNIEEEFRRAYENARKYLRDQEEKITFCTSALQMKTAFAQGKDAAFLAIEDLSFMGKEVENISELGFRFAMLTWNYANQYAVGSVCDQKGRVTGYGKEMVSLLTGKGIIPDISHLSDAGVDDLLKLTDKPFIASHSNVRDVCDVPRNVTKEQLQEIIRRKGLIGMNFFRPLVGQDNAVGFDWVLRHMDAVLSIGGEDVLAMGSDLDGCDGLFPDGFQGVENIPLVIETMKNAGFGQKLIDKIMFENAYSFIERNL